MIENETKTTKNKTKPKINYREAIIIWVGAAILLIIGTSTKSYVFEILAIIMIIFPKTNKEEEIKKETC
jgi:flagellar motor component MotA